MSIVCGTDFSENSAPALQAAGAVAARLKDRELWLVHVLDGGLSRELDSVERENLKERSSERLRAEAQQLRERFSLPQVHAMVLVGSAPDVLAE